MISKQLSSSMMPFLKYGMMVIWLFSISSLLWSFFNDSNTDFLGVLILIYLIFGLYILFIFSRFRTIKFNDENYYLTSLINNKTEVIRLDKIIIIRPIRYIGLFLPWNKVFVYKDNDGKQKKVLFLEKFGLF